LFPESSYSPNGKSEVAGSKWEGSSKSFIGGVIEHAKAQSSHSDIALRDRIPAQMLCPACKSAVSDDQRFCLHCGHYLGEPDSPTIVRGTVNELRSARRWPLVLTGVLTGILLLIVGGLITVTMFPNLGKSTSSNLPKNDRAIVLTSSPTLMPRPTPATTPIPELQSSATATPMRTILVNQSFGLSAGQVREFKLTVQSPGRIQGRFRAAGGFGNDIHVMLTDGGVIMLYDSGRTSAGSVDVAVGVGEYHLIFDNSYAKFFGKHVGATFYSVH